jgi:transcriptional regulator with XRE-family HTH domain
MSASHREADVYALVIGAVVSQLRESRGWTQKDLSEKVGTTQPTLSRIERGRGKPDAYMIRSLARAFGMSPARLNNVVEDAYARTADAARRTTRRERNTPWWKVALMVAGAAGLAGLAAFAVSAALAEDRNGEA